MLESALTHRTSELVCKTLRSGRPALLHFDITVARRTTSPPPSEVIDFHPPRTRGSARRAQPRASSISRPLRTAAIFTLGITHRQLPRLTLGPAPTATEASSTTPPLLSYAPGDHLSQACTSGGRRPHGAPCVEARIDALATKTCVIRRARHIRAILFRLLHRPSHFGIDSHGE